MIMLTRIAIIFVVGGLPCVLSAQQTWSAGRIVSADEMAHVLAGQLVYCASPAGTCCDCTDCQDDGNGGYVKCLNTGVSYLCETDYSDPRNPSPTCELTNVNCGGTARHYVSHTCTGTSYNPDTCLRVYTNPTTGWAPGVNCDLE